MKAHVKKWANVIIRRIISSDGKEQNVFVTL